MSHAANCVALAAWPWRGLPGRALAGSDKDLKPLSEPIYD